MSVRFGSEAATQIMLGHEAVVPIMNDRLVYERIPTT